MKPIPVICITGPDGSGKTTLIKNLQPLLPGSVTVSIWDVLHEPALRDVVPFSHPAQVDAYLCRLHKESRSLFLMHCLFEAMALAQAKQASCIITDSYWYKYYATEAALGTPRAYLNQLVSVFPLPAYLFYLRAPVSLAGTRKQQYSRYECGLSAAPDEVAFTAFQQKAHQEMEAVLQLYPHIDLDAKQSIETSLAAVLQKIQPLLCTPA
jgi:thymidylate kinase